MTTIALPPILTSGSAFDSFLSCARKRYWSYEAISQVDEQGNVVSRGYERKSMSLPLSTGGWCHKVVQGLFVTEGNLASPFVNRDELWTNKLFSKMWDWLPEGTEIPTTYSEVINASKAGYLHEVIQRGLSLGLQLDGFIPEEKFVERTIAEQAALIEAFGWAFVRVRLPRILAEYEIVDVEREEFTLLSADVGLQARCDAVLRRREDGRLFVYNLKTSHNPNDQRWRESWLTDQQIMTETLAVERRLGERVYGVIIDGFDKGPRVNVWWRNLKEIREGSSKPPAQGDEKWQAQRSRLLYGYRCEDIPGRPTLYDFEGTTRKGWEKFAVWEEQEFEHQPYASATNVTYASPVAYWINWLPIEQVEASFVTLEPIMRQDEQVESKVRQIVAQEQNIRAGRSFVSEDEALLDIYFPQHTGYNCGSGGNRCAFYSVCWDGEDPRVSDRFQPHHSNHPILEDE